MTKNNWLEGFSIVVEPVIDRIEIPLSSFTPFINAVAEVDDEYDISWDMMETFLDRHKEEIRGMIGEKISIQSKKAPWTK